VRVQNERPFDDHLPAQHDRGRTRSPSADKGHCQVRCPVSSAKRGAPAGPQVVSGKPHLPLPPPPLSAGPKLARRWRTTDADSKPCASALRIGPVRRGGGGRPSRPGATTCTSAHADHERVSPITVRSRPFSTSKRRAGRSTNVIRDGEWIVRFVEGEFSLQTWITDIIDHESDAGNGKQRAASTTTFLPRRQSPNSRRGGSMRWGCIAVIYPPKKRGEGDRDLQQRLRRTAAWMDVPAWDRGLSRGAFVK